MSASVDDASVQTSSLLSQLFLLPLDHCAFFVTGQIGFNHVWYYYLVLLLLFFSFLLECRRDRRDQNSFLKGGVVLSSTSKFWRVIYTLSSA